MKARPITQKDVEKTLRIAGKDPNLGARNRAIIFLTAYAGMRIGEVGGLSLADVWDRTAKKVRPSIRLLAKKTKTGSARTVFLSERVREGVAEYRRMPAGRSSSTRSMTRWSRSG